MSDKSGKRVQDDDRIDSRLRGFFEKFGSFFEVASKGHLEEAFPSRQALLAKRSKQAAKLRTLQKLQTQQFEQLLGDKTRGRGALPWDEALLEEESHSFVSHPDGNNVKLNVIRPGRSSGKAGPFAEKKLPCVYYIHGGGMASQSAFDVIYRTWGRVIASRGVVVAMIDFRNCEMGTEGNPHVAPFPAGLNDCLSGLRFLHANASALGVDTGKVCVCGESGGGNLAIALALLCKEKSLLYMLPNGVYAMCPYIAGSWKQTDRDTGILGTSHLNSVNNGLFIGLHASNGAVGYGTRALLDKNPLAWPAFASQSQLAGLPPVVIQLNECDPLRDEGLLFYRRLMAAGVRARCVESLGTIHAAELFVQVVPDISLACAESIAAFASKEEVIVSSKL